MVEYRSLEQFHFAPEIETEYSVGTATAAQGYSSDPKETDDKGRMSQMKTMEQNYKINITTCLMTLQDVNFESWQPSSDYNDEPRDSPNNSISLPPSNQIP